MISNYILVNLKIHTIRKYRRAPETKNQLIKADLHLHTKYSTDSNASVKSVIDRCLKTNLDCIAITDHNSIQGALEIRRKAPFKVIIGEEIKSTGGDIIGLFLTRLVPPGLTPKDTISKIKEQGGLVMIPHPFDRVRPSAIGETVFKEIITHTDIVETYNSRNLFKADDQKAAVAAFVNKVIPGVASDAHTAGELGKTYNLMPDFDSTPEGFLKALTQATAVTSRTKFVHRFAPSYARFTRFFRS